MSRNLEVMSAVKKICLELLLEVDRICKKHKIRYFLYGGTLLGAVRHEGFIPWDDDIDILIFRDDYNRFIKACNKELKVDYFLETSKTEPLSIVTWGKLHKKNTSFIHDNVPKGCFQGISIDIFAFDKIPENKVMRFLFGKFHNSINFIYSQRFGYRSENPSFKRRVFNLLIDCTKFIPDITFKNWYHDLSTKYNKYDNLNFGIHNSFRKFHKKVMPIKYFEETCYLKFEGHKLCAPKEWDKILKSYYGVNYMDLPPENERVYHHASIIDPFNSWEKYLNKRGSYN
ncbi:LicD family protein [Bacillus sp. ISL-18]|uniref:LicD family protein n=1 Tax=Bacillus sp. ISL-18 TaxID=2819118 RepID=UPI001BE9C0BE|nr:LicD family protein [Bacillus sp. ISL-18]MBT2657088.1 LicD family protein [Bacillus sp. ISL-18]